MTKMAPALANVIDEWNRESERGSDGGDGIQQRREKGKGREGKEREGKERESRGKKAGEDMYDQWQKLVGRRLWTPQQREIGHVHL